MHGYVSGGKVGCRTTNRTLGTAGTGDACTTCADLPVCSGILTSDMSFQSIASLMPLQTLVRCILELVSTCSAMHLASLRDSPEIALVWCSLLSMLVPKLSTYHLLVPSRSSSS